MAGIFHKIMKNHSNKESYERRIHELAEKCLRRRLVRCHSCSTYLSSPYVLLIDCITH